MTKNLLEYACWKIIDKYKNSENKVNAFVFNKTMSILNKQLLDIGMDIKLPRCWYYYGEQVVPKELPYQVICDGLGMEETKTTFKWKGDSPLKPPKKDKRKIDSRIDSVYSKFPPNSDIHEAVNKVYEYAPYEFQRAYSIFRSDFQLKGSIDKGGILRSKLLYLDFNKAMNCFQFEDFPEFRVPAKKLELVASTIFKEHPKQNQIGIDMAVDFWRIFCKYLRISKKGHHYVSAETLELWHKSAEENMKKYKESLEIKISEILSKYTLKSLNDPLIIAFLQPISLGENFRNFSSEIDSTIYG